MKTKSRTDLVNNLVFFATVIFLIGIIIFLWKDISIGIGEKIWITILLSAVSALMLWLRFGTFYEITDEYLKYQTGPIKGKIKISSIRTLEVGKTMWSGTMPATALNGIIVKFNKYDEIYISPQSNQVFANELLKINSEITVNYH